MKPHGRAFGSYIGKRAARKQRARRQSDGSIWLGLGLFGMVGWSVALPTLLGLAVGIWLDGRWPSHVSWTLTGLVLGIIIGCLNAWFWISQERRAIEQHRTEDDDAH